MRPEDLIALEPTPRELSAAMAELPKPDPGMLEAVKIQLESTRCLQGPAELPAFLEAPRRRADTRVAATPVTSHRPVVGGLVIAAKETFRTAFQPFINEMLRRQVEFNESIVEALITIHDQLQLAAQTNDLRRAALETRIAALEAQLRAQRK